MNGKWMRRLSACLALLFFGGVEPVHAEESRKSPLPPTSDTAAAEDEEKPETDEAIVYDEIVTVTAKTFEASLVETPHAITVVDHDEIARSAGANVGELLRGAPGIAASNDGSWGVNPTLRGLKKERIIVMTDGIRVNSSQPYGAIASFADPGGFERVEVVKGPASMLYGSGAMGGVVNLVSRELLFTDGFSIDGDFAVGGSSADEGHSESGTVTLTHRRHCIELKLSGMNRGDYEAPGGTVKRTGYGQWGLASRYRLKLDERRSLGIGFRRDRVEDVWYPGSSRPHPSTQVGIATVRSPRQARTILYATFKAALGGATASHLGLHAYHQEVERDMFAYSENLGKDFLRGTVPFATTGGGAKYDLFLGDSHTLTVGLDFWDMVGKPVRWMDMPPVSDNAVRVDPFKNGSIRSLGVFVQDDVSLGDWTVKLGARYDRVTGDADQVGSGPGAWTTGLDHTDDTVSWSAGTVYRRSESLHPYANVALGYRAADMRERFESAIRADGFLHVGNPRLDRERIVTAEVGMRGSSGRLTYDLSAYRGWIDDFIAGRETGEVDPATGFPIKQTENLSEVEISGMEIRLQCACGHGLDAYLLGSLQRGENEYDDEPLFEMPPAEGTVGLTYMPGRRWDAGICWRVVDRQDRVAVRFSNAREDPTAGFSKVDLRAGYRPSERLEIFLGLRNLLDREYHEHLTQGVSGTEIKAPGRGLYVGMRLRS